MRLWHYKLLSILPDLLIFIQWRECIMIKKNLMKNDLSNKIVAYIGNYDKEYFFNYISLVYDEMTKRNLSCNIKNYHEFCDFCETDKTNDKMYDEHNDRYMKQCFYCLQEKADRGIITNEDFKKIQKFVEENYGWKCEI